MGMASSLVGYAMSCPRAHDKRRATRGFGIE